MCSLLLLYQFTTSGLGLSLWQGKKQDRVHGKVDFQFSFNRSLDHFLRVLRRNWPIKAVLSWGKRTLSFCSLTLNLWATPGTICGLGQGSFPQQDQSLKGDDTLKWDYHCVINLLIYTPVENFSLASFYGESYVELNIIEVSSEFSLQLKFQTSKPQGLLFLAAGKNDYCIIELLSGNLRVRFS